jgi:ParB/RepB/Spo0J family partition protein
VASRKRDFEDIARRDAERTPTVAANQPSDREKEGRSKAKLQMVSAFKLRPHPLQPPERHSEENVADLLVSIIELGLQEPPLVWRQEDGSHVILFGNRRTRAWQLGALDGRLDEKIRAFVRSDLSEGEAVKLMMAEYAHRVAFSTLHIARLVGETSRYLSMDQGDDISTRKLAAVLPWEKTQIHEYLTINRALQDPRLAPHVRRADSAPISLLCAILTQHEFSTRLAALEAYAEKGAAAATQVMRAAKPVRKGGRPLKTVTRTKRGDGLDLTVRIRPTMTEAQVEEAREALSQGFHDLETIPRQAADHLEE